MSGLFVLPLVYFFVISFWTVRARIMRPAFSLANYAETLSEYGGVLSYTALTAGAVAVLTTIVAFAFAYRFLAEVQGGPFFGAQGEGDVADDLFFSFITLTTTGYGNLVPADNPGQSIAVLEALLGQLFLVTAVAKIVTAWKPRAWNDPGTPAP